MGSDLSGSLGWMLQFLALVLVGAALLSRSYAALRAVDSGFEAREACLPFISSAGFAVELT